MIEVKKREGESANTFIYRFNKRVQQSGLIKEVRKRQFRRRTLNQQKRRGAALYRVTRKRDLAIQKKKGK